MIETREMTASDRRFVAPTWAHSAHSSEWKRLTLPECFKRIDQILARADVKVICKADGLTVHAWLARDGRGLLWVYVPPDVQGHGVARELIKHVFGDYSEKTRWRIHRAAEQAAARRARAARKAA